MPSTEMQTSAIPLGELRARTRPGPRGCWEWMGYRNRDGYGELMHRRRRTMAHRWAWEAAHGPIPEGARVLHRCDNPPCINPAHLFLGTDQDNVADRVAKGRSRMGPYGHTEALAGENNPAAKITWPQAEEIRCLYRAGAASQRALARRFGLSQVTIGRIVRGQLWRTRGAPSEVA